MKRVIMALLLVSVFAQAELYDLLEKETTGTMRYGGKEYVIDKTCSLLDLKKLIIVMNDLHHSRPSKRFYLDMCTEYNNLYYLEKKRVSGRYSPTTMTEKWKYLLSIAPNSYYINFYGHVFRKESHQKIPIHPKPLIENPENDYSKYFLIWQNRKKNSVGSKESYLKAAFREGKPLLKSKHDIIYLLISEDIKNYLFKKKLYDKYVEFLNYQLKENKKRGFNNWKVYLELAEFYFNQEYLYQNKINVERIVDYLKKSWKESPGHRRQIALYNKLWIMEKYFELKDSWPRYITDVQENDKINKEKKELKIHTKYVSKKYYYLAALRAFLLEKLYYIKRDSLHIPEDLKANIRYQLLNEKNIKRRVYLKEKLKLLNEGKFLHAETSLSQSVHLDGDTEEDSEIPEGE